MQPGTVDLIFLGIIFIGLQVWWIIHVVRQSNIFNNDGSHLRDEINKLERIYRK